MSYSGMPMSCVTADEAAGAEVADVKAPAFL